MPKDPARRHDTGMRLVSHGPLWRPGLHQSSWCAWATLASALALACGLALLVNAEFPQSEEAGHGVSEIQKAPCNLVREVAQKELDAVDNDHSLWRYRKHREDKTGEKVIEVYQTNSGDVDRVVSINEQNLSDKELRAEDERVEKLVRHPGKMRERQRRQRADTEQLRNLLKILPDASQFEFDSRKGSLVKLRFKPNPNFHPSGHAAEALHHMEGFLVVDDREKRIAQMSGQLVSDVKFGGGLLGHLDKGGSFFLRQQAVGPQHWDLTELRIQMNGKAFCFKNIAIQQSEIYTDYISVRSDISLRQAAELLRRDASIKTASTN